MTLIEILMSIQEIYSTFPCLQWEFKKIHILQFLFQAVAAVSAVLAFSAFRAVTAFSAVQAVNAVLAFSAVRAVTAFSAVRAVTSFSAI